MPSRRRDSHPGEQLLRLRLTKGRLVAWGLFVLSTLAFLYFVLPKLVGLDATWNRLRQGDVWWLALAFALEVGSFVGWIVLFRAVFARGRGSIGWRASYEITMASVAATRLFASAGAGGIALTAWALRRSGMSAQVAARLLIAFIVLVYGVFMAALVIGGVGLFTGIVPGGGPFVITMVPAIFGAVVIAAFVAMLLIRQEPGEAVARLRARGRLGLLAARVAGAPATLGAGVRCALELIRSRDPRLLGALAWWAFDIATLWACFHAFGVAPPKGVIVMAYLVGMFGNVLPLPGGIGGVEGGMIGAFTVFGVKVQVAIVAVLAYRAFSFWLPTLPGAIAYVQLRRTVQRWRTEAGDAAPSYTL